MSLRLANFIASLNEDFSDYCSSRLGHCGITPGQISFLVYIGDHPDCSPTQLANAIRADSGHTARLIKKFVSCNLATRVQDKNDKRSCTIRLTTLGESRVVEIKKLYVEWENAITAVLDENERETLLSILTKMRGL